MNYKNRTFLQSLGHAYEGVKLSLQSERNIKIQLLLLIIVVLIGMILGFSPVEWVVITLSSVFVLGAEMFNTAIEITIDMICHEQFHPLAKKVKDIAAGAVLLASIGALIIGCIIIFPKIIDLIA